MVMIQNWISKLIEHGCLPRRSTRGELGYRLTDCVPSSLATGTSLSLFLPSMTVSSAVTASARERRRQTEEALSAAIGWHNCDGLAAAQFTETERERKNKTKKKERRKEEQGDFQASNCLLSLTHRRQKCSGSRRAHAGSARGIRLPRPLHHCAHTLSPL